MLKATRTRIIIATVILVIAIVVSSIIFVLATRSNYPVSSLTSQPISYVISQPTSYPVSSPVAFNELVNTIEVVYEKTINNVPYVYLNKGINSATQLFAGAYPVFSPDHNQIAYDKVTLVGEGYEGACRYKTNSIYIFDVVKQTETELLKDLDCVTTVATWSPDGKYLLLSTYYDAPVIDLKIIDINKKQEVTKFRVFASQYYFTNDHQLVYTEAQTVDPAYPAGDGSANGISVFDFNTFTNKRIIPANAKTQYSLSVPRDSKRIYFHVIQVNQISDWESQGKSQVYDGIMQLDGRDMRPISPDNIIETVRNKLNSSYPRTYTSSSLYRLYLDNYSVIVVFPTGGDTNSHKLMLVDTDFNFATIAQL